MNAPNVIQLDLDPKETYWARIICINPGQNPDESGTPPTFEYLSGENQPFPFVIGPDSTHSLQGMTSHEAFFNVGFPSSWLTEKTAHGLEFHLVVFRESKCLEAMNTRPLNATWANLLALIRSQSPVCADKLEPHWVAIQQMECVEGGPIDKVPAHMYGEVSSLQGFANSTLLTTPELGRMFLRHTLKCTSLYKGDGYAYDQEGNQGVKEYLVPRVLTADLDPQVVRLHWVSE
jgi:hypothetical protein